MKKKICVITSTRAEYGLLRMLLLKLEKDNDIDLKILVTGTHLSNKYGNTQKEIYNDGFKYDTLAIPLNGDSKINMVNNMGDSIKLFGNYLHTNQPDCVIVLGDRYEILAFSLASYMLSIPIIHISGGDVTEGAMDDGFRNCISKLSSLHFPGCISSRDRLIQMGEMPETVCFVGDTGVENCKNTELWSLKALESDLKFQLTNKRFGIVTFHPVTNDKESPSLQLKELIKALNYFNDMQFIITTANADAGGREINEIWDNESKIHPNWLVVKSLGLVRYLSAVKHSNVVIGNSSSGIVEAPVLQVPTVNIGDRQKGRDQAASVINCKPQSEDIVKAIKKALSKEYINIAQTCESPFGSGNTSSDMVRIIKDKLNEGTLTTVKKFYDIKV